MRFTPVVTASALAVSALVLTTLAPRAAARIPRSSRTTAGPPPGAGAGAEGGAAGARAA